MRAITGVSQRVRGLDIGMEPGHAIVEKVPFAILIVLCMKPVQRLYAKNSFKQFFIRLVALELMIHGALEFCLALKKNNRKGNIFSV